MTFDYLLEFIELARYLNFTEAAAHLHITQSTLSKHISAMERELGVALFVRQHDGARLTEEGFLFFGSATNIIDIYQTTHQTMLAMRDQSALLIDGQFQNPNVSALISTAIARFRTQCLGKIIFNRNQTKPKLDLLTEGDIDLLVMGESSDRLNERGLEFSLLTELPFAAIVDTTHPFAERESITINDLENEVLLQFLDEYSAPGWRTIEEVCRDHGFVPRRRPALTQSTTEQLTIPLNGGVLLFPSTSKELRFLTTAAQRACVPVVDSDAIFRIYCIFKPEARNKVAPFLECVDRAIDSLGN